MEEKAKYTKKLDNTCHKYDWWPHSRDTGRAPLTREIHRQPDNRYVEDLYLGNKFKRLAKEKEDENILHRDCFGGGRLVKTSSKAADMLQRPCVLTKARKKKSYHDALVVCYVHGSCCARREVLPS